MEETQQRPIEVETSTNTITTIQEVKSKKTPLFYINILLLLVVFILGAYILHREGFLGKREETKNKKQEESIEANKNLEGESIKEKEPGFNNFVGKYIKARIPKGWSIKEYENGNGATDTITEETKYAGLTGLEVKKDDTVVLKFQAIDGYGSSGCLEIAHFRDFSQKFEDDMKSQNDEMGDKTIILDFTNTKYVEIDLFGLRLRRVDKTLYYDDIEGDPYFQAQCLKQIVVFKDLKFSAGEGPYKTEMGHFVYTIDKNTTSEDLKTLDEILKSMSLK